MPNVEQYKAQDFIDAIPGSGGIISTIARRVGCSWHTAQHYINTHPTVQRAYSDECELIADMAESAVIKAIQTGNVGASKWYLATKGAIRGYAQKQDIELTSGGSPLFPFQDIVAALKRAAEQLQGHGTE